MTIDDIRAYRRQTLERPALLAVPAAFDRPFAGALHGVRGIAALAVLWSHVLALLAFEAFSTSPLGLMAGGGAAVALFYVLSGAVLAISLRRYAGGLGETIGYGVRRLFRLYPLLIATSAFALAYLLLLHPRVASPLFEASFFGHYDEAFSPVKIAASFLGLIDKLNPPTWSIFVELVASALMPLFVLGARTPARAAVLTLALLVVSFAMRLAPDSHVLLYRWPAFMVNFAAGILALHIGLMLRPSLARLGTAARVLLPIALFLVLMNGRALMDAAGYAYGGHADPVTNLFEVVVSVALVVLLLEAPPRFALSAPLKALGDLSYGIYLIHFPMLFTVAGLFVLGFGNDALGAHRELFAIGLAVTATLATLAASALAWRWLEAPMIAAGRGLSRRIAGKD